MEAANRGASEAAQDHRPHIGLPHEQQPNPYITHALSLEFHYFFMRKLWFAYLARALVVFPGGFGMLDELAEILTLMQTRKIDRPIPIVAVRIELLERNPSILKLSSATHDRPRGSQLFQFADDPEDGTRPVAGGIAAELEETTPALAHSRPPK